MCTPKPPTKPHTLNPNMDDQEQLHRWPTPSEALQEMKEVAKISGPTTITGLILYSRSMISMLFLGHLGELELSGGSLSIAFANITGYSIISGLSMGMDPICGQAYGAHNMKLLGLTLQRTILLLLTTSLFISLVWLNVKPILLFCNQDQQISTVAQKFIAFSIPDLFFLSVLHPMRVYLRAQGETLPITYCSCASVIMHLPLNFLLVSYFRMGVSGVALAMVVTDLNLLILLSVYVCSSRGGVHVESWVGPGRASFQGWPGLLALAVPTCVSVCLEWWWYELMIVMCGLLPSPRASIASMGILIQTTSLLYVFPSSLGLGASARVGRELGARRPGRARLAAVVAVGCGVGMGAGAAAFAAAAARRGWGRMFTGEAEVLGLTGAALPILGLCEIGNCPQTAGCGVLRGSARPGAAANVNLAAFYLVGMPAAVGMGFGMGMGFTGLWLGLLAAQAACAVMMVVVLGRTDWAAQAERAMELTARDEPSKSVTVETDPLIVV